MPDEADAREERRIAETVHGQVPATVRPRPEGLGQPYQFQARFVSQPDRPSP